MKAMELTEIDVDDPRVVDLINDDWYQMQQKLDGTRVLTVFGEDSKPTFTTRKGTEVKYAAARQYLNAVAGVLAPAEPGFVLDGELMLDGTYHVFDCYLPGRPDEPFYIRDDELIRYLGGLRRDNEIIKPVPLIRGKVAKELFLQEFRDGGYEGVVFRNNQAAYEVGIRSKNIIKVKFVKTAEAFVLDFTRGRNEAGREVGSATLGVYASGVQVPIGSVSLIGKDQVAVGDVVEFKYLYWTGGAVVQPRMVRRRDDKSPADCAVEQFPTYRREAYQWL